VGPVTDDVTVTSPVDPTVDAPRATRDDLVLITVFVALAVATFHLPALEGGFLNWDDPEYVTANPHIRNLSWSTVRWAFTTFDASNWHPVTWLSLALDYRLWGLDPRGYHLTSLVLHVANAVLVLLVLHALTGALWQSAAVAALFGVHPMHVESVAWVAERKDVLCAFFWLLTIGAYIRWVRSPGWGGYAIVVVATMLALLAKPMAVTLPAMLLLIDWWPLHRLSWRAVAEKIPLVTLALAAALATFLAQTGAGAVAIDPIPFPARLTNAIVAYFRYLALTAWPLRLSPWYSHPAVEGPPLSAWTVAGAVVVLAAITGLALATRRGRPYLLVGWLWYVGMLLPVIGLVQAGRQAMADRFTYLPHLGLFIALAWGIGDLAAWGRPAVRALGATGVCVLIVALGALSFRQTRIWHDSTAFWAYTVRVNPYAFIAHQALGGLLNETGKPRDALREFLQARRLRPDIAAVHRNVGRLLLRQRRYAAAAAAYRKAVALRPDSADDEKTLGDVLLAQGRPARARWHLERAVALRPSFAEAHGDLGRALLAGGRVDDAVAEFQNALAIKPDLSDARRGLDAALARRAAGPG
jgi:tetratricopeptide (TPR) repeat protein